MIAKLVDLGRNDRKGMDFLIQSLTVSAHDHVLSRKLIAFVSAHAGTMSAIVPQWINPAHLASYNLGHGPSGAIGDDLRTGRPVELLAAIAQEYLSQSPGHVVISENFAWDVDDIPHLPCVPPRIAWFGTNDVLHVLTFSDAGDLNVIEDSVGEYHHWQTGVFTKFNGTLESRIYSEDTLDAIVLNARCVFVPAFDCSGYLLWWLIA